MNGSLKAKDRGEGMLGQRSWAEARLDVTMVPVTIESS